jgi:hypothetical protein
MTGCVHPRDRQVDVTDFDSPGRIDMCRDCGRQTVAGDPPVLYSVASPVEVVADGGETVEVRALNGDTWTIPAVLFHALYRPPADPEGER